MAENFIRRILFCQTFSVIFKFAGYNQLRFQSRSPNLPTDIKFNELHERLNEKTILLIDVRDYEELKEDGFIKNALNIALSGLGDMVLLSPDTFRTQTNVQKPAFYAPLATMCRSGVRARTAQLALIGAGYKDVRCYAGSFQDWLENNGEIVRFKG